MHRRPRIMSEKRGLWLATVMSLFVPGQPANQSQQYRSPSTSAWHDSTASFLSSGFWYCPLKALGQFFHLIFMQSTDPIQPGRPRAAKLSVKATSSAAVGGRFKN